MSVFTRINSSIFTNATIAVNDPIQNGTTERLVYVFMHFYENMSKISQQTPGT